MLYINQSNFHQYLVQFHLKNHKFIHTYEMRIKKNPCNLIITSRKKNKFWKKVERNFCRNFMWIYLCVTLACFRVKSEIGFSVYIHCISWKATQFNQLIQVRTKIALAKKRTNEREREREMERVVIVMANWIQWRSTDNRQNPHHKHIREHTW